MILMKKFGRVWIFQKNQHVQSIIGIVDNKIYLTGTEEWGSQYPSKIYSVDLKKKKVKEEIKLKDLCI